MQPLLVKRVVLAAIPAIYAIASAVVAVSSGIVVAMTPKSVLLLVKVVIKERRAVVIVEPAVVQRIKDRSEPAVQTINSQRLNAKWTQPVLEAVALARVQLV